MASIFQYWNGAAWVTDSQKVRLTVVDTLNYPLYLEITLANPNNTKDATFSDYQQVRFFEHTSGVVLFYGKIERVEPIWDGTYGQCIKLSARDNLNELLKRLINEDLSGLYTRRSQLIAGIISNNSYTGNIDTTDANKFNASTVALGAGVLDVDFVGSGKTALRAITEIAQTDPWDATPTGVAYDFYLDTTFSGTTPAPDLHYFKRNTLPSAGANTNGLIIRYQGTEGNMVRSMLPNYIFPKEAQERVTIARIYYVDAAGKSQSISAILVNINNIAGGPFTLGETVTGGVSGTTGVVEYRSNTFLCLSSWSGVFTIGEQITGGTSGATANIVSVPRQSISQDIEFVERNYHIKTQAAARDRIATLLLQGGDTITRGEVEIIRWPFYILTGTHTGANNAAILTDAVANFTGSGVFQGLVVENLTDGSSATISAITGTTITGALSGGTDNDWDTGDSYRIYVLVRTGHVVRVDCSPVSINEDMLVTRIIYDEGPGILNSKIEVLRIGRGAGVSTHVIEKIEKEAETALWQSTGATGGLPIGSLSFNTNLDFDPAGAPNAYRQAAWGAGTITTSDGTVYNIGAGNTGNLAATGYIYLDTDVSLVALQTSTTYSNATGQNKLFIALVMPAANTNSDIFIQVFNATGVRINADVLAANLILATNIIAGTFGGDRWEITPTGIRGYDGAVLQVELLNSGANAGRIWAGAGSVILDSLGIRIINGDTNPHAIIFERTTYNRIALFSGVDGAFSGLILSELADGLLASGPLVLGGLDIQFGHSPFIISGPGGVNDTAIISLGAVGLVRPNAIGHNFGNSTYYWNNGYFDNLYTQGILRRSSFGGAIGTAAAYFLSSYINSTYTNNITTFGGGSTITFAAHIEDDSTHTLGTAANVWNTAYVDKIRSNTEIWSTPSTDGSGTTRFRGGWLATNSGTFVGPYNDAAVYWFFRVRNIADNASLNHAIAPSVAGYGWLGSDTYYWARAYADAIYAQNIYRRSGFGGQIGATGAVFTKVWTTQLDGDGSPIVLYDNLVPVVSGAGETVGEAARFFVAMHAATGGYVEHSPRKFTIPSIEIIKKITRDVNDMIIMPPEVSYSDGQGNLQEGTRIGHLAYVAADALKEIIERLEKLERK